jgi:hypothetical protein
MKYVLAGNHHQFELWLRETNTPRSEARPIANRIQLRGLAISPSDIVRYGSYFERPDYHELEREISMVTRERSLS